MLNKETVASTQQQDKLVHNSATSELLQAAKGEGYKEAIQDAQAGRMKGYGIYTEEQVHEMMAARKAATIRTIRRLRGAYNLPTAAELLIRDIEEEIDI